MRVIKRDNFGMSGEAPGKDEEFITANLPQWLAEQLARDLNGKESGGDHALWIYVVVPEDYKLQEFQP